VAARTILDGRPIEITIAPGGYSLVAPGLSGAVIEMTATETATRADAGTHELRLQEALQGADIHSVKVFEIEVAAVDPSVLGAMRSGGARTTDSGEPAMVLRSPYFGAQTEQAVLYTDEAGVTQWVFPHNASGGAGAVSRDSAGQSTEFFLPLESASLPHRPDAGTGTRGLFTKFGRRLVHVLAWGTGDILGKGALAAATLWESQRRPYGFRRFPFGDDLAAVSWDELSKGRALLLIHGTFSTAYSGFGFVSETAAALMALYGGRVFAFEHPSLHQSPIDNVRQLFASLPPNVDLELDIVTHSRGGLIGRELTERASQYEPQGSKIRVRRAIFVAAPHRGTILTDSKHGIKMLDRYTNLFTDLPDDAFTITIEALFMLAKLIYHGAAGALPGLRSMYPPSDYLQDLNTLPNHDTQYYAIGADFKPIGSRLLSRFGWSVAAAAIDGVFEEANDGVVPTSGSYELQSTVTGFPIPSEQRVLFRQQEGIHHCNYFSAKRVNQQIVNWLSAPSKEF
jgi:hypothetical protein